MAITRSEAIYEILSAGDEDIEYAVEILEALGCEYQEIFSCSGAFAKDLRCLRDLQGVKVDGARLDQDRQATVCGHDRGCEEQEEKVHADRPRGSCDSPQCKKWPRPTAQELYI